MTYPIHVCFFHSFIYFLRPIHFPRTTFALPPSNDSDSGSHSGPPHLMHNANYLCTLTKNRCTWYVVEAQLDVRRQGNKLLKSSRDKNECRYRSGEGEGGPRYVPDPGSGVLLGGSARIEGNITHSLQR